MKDIAPRIELLTLGDELLLGIRENRHLKYIGGQLERHGLKLQRNMVVQDEVKEIQVAFRNSWERSDVVITTGGLGAARINNAREAIAEVLGIGLEFVEDVKNAIENDFSSINRKMGKRYMRQCYKLEGSQLLGNDFGTAPGLWFEKEGKVLIMLPGMESEMRPMFENKVIPMFQDRRMLKSSEAYLQLRTIGIDEDSLEDKLEPVLEKYPGLRVNYCLHQGILDVRLSSDAIAYTWEELKKIGDQCKQLLRDDFFAFGHKTLAEDVFQQLRTEEKTLAVAESCTGGKLSDAFTNIPGASKVFAGGVVCYNNEAKIHMLDVPESMIQQHGAVSAETAVAMATGVAEKYSTPYGLSVTGYAGPGGGDDKNPVGTVYVGYHSPGGSWAHKVTYPGQREAVKVRAVNAAFDYMRRKLKEECVEGYIKDRDH